MANSIIDQVLIASQKAEHVKVTVYKALHKEYGEVFSSRSQQDLLKSLRPLISDMQKLTTRIENEVEPKVASASSQHRDILQEYTNTRHLVDVLQLLCECHKDLSACRTAFCGGNYVVSAQHIANVETSFAKIPAAVCDIKIFQAVWSEYLKQRSFLVNECVGRWNSVINWTTSPSASWDSADGHLKTSLRVNMTQSDAKGITSSECFEEVIKAMGILAVLDSKLKMFGQQLFSHFFKPFIKFGSLSPVVETADDTCVLRIVNQHGKKKVLKQIDHSGIYSKLISVFTFVKSHLFTYSSKGTDVATGSSLDPVAFIGSCLWPSLSELIIKDILSEATPNSSGPIEKYDQVIQDARSFEESLHGLGIISSELRTISDYAKDINVSFANKVFEDLLVYARQLMLAEMHDMVLVERKNDRAAIALAVEDGDKLDKKIQAMLLSQEAIDEEFLQADVFGFPDCYISASVKKLVDHVYQTMVKATESSPSMAGQLVHSCRNIFELFVCVTPVYHKDSLKLPQLAALHYNNCMYLSHHCVTLGHQFRNNLPPPLNSEGSTFMDLVAVLRKCGTSCFLQQLQLQQQELLDMLKPCAGFVDCLAEDRVAEIKKAFSQVIRHLTRLANVWMDVLPVNIFKHSEALLLNAVLESIISSVLRIEDFSADEAGSLVAMFNFLIDKTPEVVQSSYQKIRDIDFLAHVRFWKKFKFLALILNADLQEIVNMWTQSDSELSSAMDAGEVRSLVRALFQNTDRRSQALAKIKQSCAS